MLIYKILTAAEWREFQKISVFNGSKVDIADGFIHFSTAAQAPETAAKHFASLNDLFILAVESSSLGESLRWEPSRGGALFPHLYAKLPLSAVRWSAPLPQVSGGHVFPERMR